jgi:hypothetical protein
MAHTIDPQAYSSEELATLLNQFYARKYFVRERIRGRPDTASLEAETTDLINTTASFVGRTRDGFRTVLDAMVRAQFPIQADERQKAMGLSYVTAPVDGLISLVIHLLKAKPGDVAHAASRSGSTLH